MVPKKSSVSSSTQNACAVLSFSFPEFHWTKPLSPTGCRPHRCAHAGGQSLCLPQIPFSEGGFSPAACSRSDGSPMSTMVSKRIRDTGYASQLHFSTQQAFPNQQPSFPPTGTGPAPLPGGGVVKKGPVPGLHTDDNDRLGALAGSVLIGGRRKWYGADCESPHGGAERLV